MKELSYHNPIVQYDLDTIIAEKYAWDKLNGKSVLITGANGMLASYLVYTLFRLNQILDFNIKIIALVRNFEKAQELFSAMAGDENFELITQDVIYPINYSGKIDYIVHAAGSASPYAIVHDPVGIVKANTLGTFNVLELAKTKKTEKVLFTSTREVYGKTEGIAQQTETDFGTIDPLDSRSCYPESKRMAETILKSYELQYGINFNTVRIAHSYGPGMKLDDDGRIMADLISNVIHNQNIVLKSTGEAIRAFCYITDAVKAIFLVLLEGERGKAYNIANETEPIAIKNLAELLVSLQLEKKLQITFEIAQESKGYTNYTRVELNTEKIERLGWFPTVTLKNGLLKTIQSFES
jgi:nucleoside-diphosphate-sugar epimerase